MAVATMNKPVDVLDEIKALKASGEPFAVATVVRTVALTAAKAGAKALIRSDGTMSAGWIGGGCARAAVLEGGARGAERRQAAPGLGAAGRRAAGAWCRGRPIARRAWSSPATCARARAPWTCSSSQCCPDPSCSICGASPVAVALADLGKRLGFAIAVAAPAEDHGKFARDSIAIAGLRPVRLLPATSATSSSPPRDAATRRLSPRRSRLPLRHVAFVGSHRKAAALRQSLAAKGSDPKRLAALRSPAGLNIGAVTPEEIALSILAEIVELRRRGARTAAPGGARS